jgi:Carbohydrate-selective porin, OprB family/S-layer homology domain
MTRIFWKTLLTAPVTLGVALAAAGSVVAAETAVEPIAVEPIAVEPTADVVAAEPIQLAQVTNVSELSDVQPGDWAFTALQRLVEEYGCLEGYPDQTFRGNRALTRYEFAAGLNACLDVVIQLIGDTEKIDAIQRLQEEFAAELATIRGRVDGLETDVAELEANQFSTTTKLRAQFDAHLIVPFDEADGFRDIAVNGTPSVAVPDATVIATRTGTPPRRASGPEADATFEYRARLNFDTSFTGEDRLRIRLQASDDALALANTERGLANQSSRRNGLEDNVGLDDVMYKFPIGNRIEAMIGANSINTENLVSSTIVPFDGPSVAYAGLPEFYNLYPTGNLGAAVNFAFSDSLSLDVGYNSTSSNVNTSAGGIFNDSSYIAQLNLLTDGIFNAAVAYIDSDRTTAGTADSTIAGLLNLDFGRLQLAGHYASTNANGGGNLDSYMGGIAINDFLGKGNQFGLYGGISPVLNRDPLLVEAYYKIAVNEYFTFTPAVIYTDNDSGIGTQDNIYGALRASFKF